jgi:hypothetical protein
MSAQLVAAMARRTGTEVADTLPLTQFGYDEAGMVTDVHPVDVGERPPAAGIDKYREGRG